MPSRTKRQIPGQLPMFMTAREITSTHSPSDWDRDPVPDFSSVRPRLETDSETMSRKLNESMVGWGGGLHRSIAAEGVQKPVHLSHQFGSQGRPEIGEGHHRIAASMDVSPDRLIPVTHHENLDALGNYILDNE